MTRLAIITPFLLSACRIEYSPPSQTIPLLSIGSPEPSPRELPAGRCAVFRDSNGDVRLWANDAGTMVATDPLVRHSLP